MGDSEALGNAILGILSDNYTSFNEHWLDQFMLKNSAQKYLDLTEEISST